MGSVRLQFAHPFLTALALLVVMGFTTPFGDTGGYGPGMVVVDASSA
jgi:hypothetical protein